MLITRKIRMQINVVIFNWYFYCLNVEFIAISYIIESPDVFYRILQKISYKNDYSYVYFKADDSSLKQRLLAMRSAIATQKFFNCVSATHR